MLNCCASCLGYCISLLKSTFIFNTSNSFIFVSIYMTGAGEEPQDWDKCISTSYPLASTKAVYEGSFNCKEYLLSTIFTQFLRTSEVLSGNAHCGFCHKYRYQYQPTYRSADYPSLSFLLTASMLIVTGASPAVACSHARWD